MTLKATPELLSFLSTYFPEADLEADEEATRAFCEVAALDRRQKVITQLKLVLEEGEMPIDELGSEANRWFGDSTEAATWLRTILGYLENAEGGDGAEMVVKDSNGALLSEGDSVQVIKDLKVKGGTSDLKRGTLIKKIHLVDDPEVVECRVDGSTLVLKTCFLKKA